MTAVVSHQSPLMMRCHGHQLQYRTFQTRIQLIADPGQQNTASPTQAVNPSSRRPHSTERADKHPKAASDMVHQSIQSGCQVGPSSHLTAHLALYLLEHAPQHLRSKDPPLPTTALNTTDRSLPTAAIESKISSLQHAMYGASSSSSATTRTAAATTATAPIPVRDDGPNVTGSTLSFSDLVKRTNSPEIAYSTTSSETTSWQGDEEDDSLDDESDTEGRSRMDAAARALSVTREDNESDVAGIYADIRRQIQFDGWREASPLDHFSHPTLTPAVAALHGYAASGGNIVFLERSYEFARTVAASKQDLSVAFDACRLALAVGYVHTLTKGAPDMANVFALKYSLPKLAQSVQQFWSCPPSSSGEAEQAWEECMLSLLEVTSSVAVMTGERNILATLDARVYGGVVQAMGLYVRGSPGALHHYHDLASACLRRHLLSFESAPDSTDTE